MRALLICSVVLSALAGVAAADWSDDFDSYATGGLHGLGGWAGWGNDQQFDAVVTDSISCSSPNSIKIIPTTDIVREFDESTGSWSVSAMQYIPGGGTGDQFFIMHNAYIPGGSFSCAHDIIFHLSTGTLEFAQSGRSASIIRDQWIEIRVEIDLDGNTQEAFYNNVSLGSAAWASSGPVEIATIDLFSYGASPVFYDDISMESVPGSLYTCSWGIVKSACHTVE